jgi:hypothetical protein
VQLVFHAMPDDRPRCGTPANGAPPSSGSNSQQGVGRRVAGAHAVAAADNPYIPAREIP